MCADNLISHSKWSDQIFLKTIKVKGYKTNIQKQQNCHSLITNYLNKRNKQVIMCGTIKDIKTLYNKFNQIVERYVH